MKTKPMKEMKMVRNWKIGDKVTPIETEFDITEGKIYTILDRDVFYDCFFIENDLGVKEAYSEEYFKLVIED